MRTKAIYVIVLGVVALGAIIAAVIAGDRGNTISISGLIAIAAACVGALATLAHDFNRPESDSPAFSGYPPQTQPPYGWQEGRGWAEDDTTQQRPPEAQ